ncbi:MAG: hypothetical protein ACYCTL_12700 [Acidimicrobiales bacterium]
MSRTRHQTVTPINLGTIDRISVPDGASASGELAKLAATRTRNTPAQAAKLAALEAAQHAVLERRRVEAEEAAATGRRYRAMSRELDARWLAQARMARAVARGLG